MSSHWSYQIVLLPYEWRNQKYAAMTKAKAITASEPRINGEGFCRSDRTEGSEGGSAIVEVVSTGLLGLRFTSIRRSSEPLPCATYLDLKKASRERTLRFFVSPNHPRPLSR